MSTLQTWVALLGGITSLLLLVVTNVVVLTRFFTRMTSRFDVLNIEVGNLKDEVRRDVDRLGGRIEGAVEKIGKTVVDSAALKARMDGIESRVVWLEGDTKR